uniref:Protein FAR1-RELATED SEQUENCE n=1 Tax=Anthurium amnicola TaxID=1678845 RepID=A0A1D1XZB5_9ARAE
MEADAELGSGFYSEGEDLFSFQREEEERDEEEEQQGKDGVAGQQEGRDEQHGGYGGNSNVDVVDQTAGGIFPSPDVGFGDGDSGEAASGGTGFVGLERQEPQLGMEFDSLESASAFYFKYAQCLGFRVRASRFRTSRRDDSIIMRRFVCYKEGFYLKREKKKADAKERRKRGSIREGCKAMFEVVRKGADRWFVAKLITEHTHAFTNTIKEHKPKKKKVEVGFPIDTTALFGEGFGHDTRRRNYWGGGGEAFNLLEYFKRMQAKNPGFFYSLQVDEQSNLVSNVFWADTKARMDYSYFGDAVAFDTTYKKSKHMMPFISFTGLNHHMQPIIFGCGIIFDESEASFSWLLQTFLTAMCGQLPVSLVTEQNEDLRAAVAKVFPGTRHRFCKWWILSKFKEEFPQLCSTHTAWQAFKAEMKRCIDESETIEDFESGWIEILIKYKLKENVWIQSLYKVCEHWATVYLKDTFFAEMSPAQRSESMHKFFQRSFEAKAAIRDFLSKFDRAMAGQYEKEVQADLANLYTRPVLKTSMQIEKQAAEAYTKTIFAIFQEELVQSSSYSYSVAKCDDGMNWKYNVVLDGENANKIYIVDFNYPEKRARCSCHKFEFSGILCRHILTVFSGLHIRKLPEDYFLKRWTQAAKSGPILFESVVELPRDCQKGLAIRYNHLCLEVFKYAAEGATSSIVYSTAKEALRSALAEVVAAKRFNK